MQKDISIEITNLIKIIAKLRAPDGCPWDRVQTPETLRPCILEEAYELLEAIDNNDSDEICAELGDLLFQVVFIAQIFSEQEKFNLAKVAHSISEKLRRRHPHVFADADGKKHSQHWEEIKRLERQDKGKSNKLENCIPTNLPALKKATKVAKRIKSADLTVYPAQIEEHSSTISKLIERLPAEQKHLESAIADLLFSTVQLSHSLHLDAEDLLRQKTIQVMQKIDQE